MRKAAPGILPEAFHIAAHSALGFESLIGVHERSGIQGLPARRFIGVENEEKQALSLRCIARGLA